MILDTFRLDGKVALVTGSSAGLGAAIAVALAEAGADVACHGNTRRLIIMKHKQQLAVLNSRWFASDNVERVLFSLCQFYSSPCIYNSKPLADHRLTRDAIGRRNQNVFDCARR